MVVWRNSVAQAKTQRRATYECCNFLSQVLMRGSKSFQNRILLKVMGCKTCKMFQLHAFCAAMHNAYIEQFEFLRVVCAQTYLNQWLTRGKKVKSRRGREIWKQFLQFREEKEKSEFPFPSFEKRKRNQKEYSQLSRREREILNKLLQFREEKENIEILFFYLESRKRKVK